MDTRHTPKHALLARIAAAGTQVRAADALGISQSYLNDLKNGRRKFSRRILGKLGFVIVVQPKEAP